MRLQKTFEKDVKSRAFFACCRVGEHMVVNGGVTAEGEILKDTWILNVEKFSWTREEIIGVRARPLAYHQFIFVAEGVNKTEYSLFNSPELLSTNTLPNTLKYKGIYCFGGLTEVEGKREYDNRLRVLRVGARPLEWNYLNLKGKSPEPRRGASLTYIEEYSSLVMFGGDNERGVFGDLWLFDLNELQYINIYKSMGKIGKRTVHSCLSKDNHIFIFGGYSENYIHDMNGKIGVFEVFDRKIRKVVRRRRGIKSQDITDITIV